MIKISLKPIKQESPNDCSITCMRMILDYYGLKISRDEIFKYIIKATPDGGSYLSEIGRFAKNKGFIVDMYAYNLYLTDSKDTDLDKRKLLEKLEKELNNSERDKYYDLMLESTIKAIRENVNYFIVKPSFKIIKNYLNRKIPVSVRINYTSLVGEQGDPFDSHDVVLSGFKDKEIFLIDPYDASEKLFNSEDVIFAINQSKIITASAYLLAVKPKLIPA